MSRVLRPAQHIIGHFGDESLQAITCTDSDNSKPEKIHQKHKKKPQNKPTGPRYEQHAKHKIAETKPKRRVSGPGNRDPSRWDPLPGVTFHWLKRSRDDQGYMQRRRWRTSIYVQYKCITSTALHTSPKHVVLPNTSAFFCEVRSCKHSDPMKSEICTFVTKVDRLWEVAQPTSCNDVKMPNSISVVLFYCM